MRKQRRFFHSFRDAGRGIGSCLRTERNMRVHLGACVLVVLLAAWLGVGREEWACLLLAMGMVTAAEAVNTAIEGLCDFIEEGHNAQIGKIKDIAAGAVLLAAVFAAAVGAVVFLPRLLGCIEMLQRYI
ncbi:diacylglycerol kinase family protein [Neglecta sp. X4]|uniref:diacylglycerol kinase family protein n=1 Tax=unclassified Neglectibacter TaxID=2632164 RepID=UPI00136D51C2|nr:MULTISPECIES: diacylglycerol kinase family protein [unclassified Neglectibacter]NBI17336.1 diacylglycerol kinase family protein [Neglectibacter sp. 59]NBJ72777.1 diacylglycerol kinase family protein [Neglectibacter sp. X4]NCE80660.1 diacylglycerol kinase family protein [Neglectibacter sp. X58]